jgi:hypothetical protein
MPGCLALLPVHAATRWENGKLAEPLATYGMIYNSTGHTQQVQHKVTYQHMFNLTVHTVTEGTLRCRDNKPGRLCCINWPNPLQVLSNPHSNLLAVLKRSLRGPPQLGCWPQPQEVTVALKSTHGTISQQHECAGDWQAIAFSTIVPVFYGCKSGQHASTINKRYLWYRVGMCFQAGFNTNSQ